MSSTPIPGRILAVIDKSEDQIALRTAAALADRHGAALEAFLCVEPPHDMGLLERVSGRPASALVDSLCEEQRDTAEQHVRHALGGRDVPIHLTVGKTFIEIIRLVLASEIDFVVKAAEPLTGANSFLFASTDQHLLRKCPCPVWLQTVGAPPIPQRVIAAIDVDTEDAPEPETLLSLSRRVVETACHVASPTGGDVIVLHAWDALGSGLVWAFSSDADASEAADAYVREVHTARGHAMEALLRDFEAARGPHATPLLRPRIVRGAPEEVIEAEVREAKADVVVMGTVARTGLSGVFIGNTAENIINSISCPVVAVKPTGFVSPLARP